MRSVLRKLYQNASHLVVVSVKFCIRVLILFIVLESFFFIVLLFIKNEPPSLPTGWALNRLAWEATYSERSLPIPQTGPREGYWGSRLELSYVPYLHWEMQQSHLPPFVDINQDGTQTIGDLKNSPCRILIIGGSVAFGTYASRIDTTYFALVNNFLHEKGLNCTTTVLAGSGWISDQEIIALWQRGSTYNPTVVIFLDGINDLTNPLPIPVSLDRHTLKKATFDYIKWKLINPLAAYTYQLNSIKLWNTLIVPKLPKSDKLTSRPPSGENFSTLEEKYLRNMQLAYMLAQGYKFKLVYIPQPTILFKKHRTAVEEEVIKLSGTADYIHNLTTSYKQVIQKLSRLADEKTSFFIDCSESLSMETATTFTDLWHFSDPGHKLLADCYQQQLYVIISNR